MWWFSSATIIFTLIVIDFPVIGSSIIDVNS